jgi:hypothetical protein
MLKGYGITERNAFMAKQPRFTEQMPFVGTKTQRLLIDNAAYADNISRADVIREAINAHFGLNDEGEFDDDRQVLPLDPHYRPRETGAPDDDD